MGGLVVAAEAAQEVWYNTPIVLVVASAITGAIVGGLGWLGSTLWQRRYRWDSDRHLAYSQFFAAADALWHQFRYDGGVDDPEEAAAASRQFRMAFSTAGLICRDQETSDAMDEVHDCVYTMFDATPESFVQADRAVLAALNRFVLAARKELGLKDTLKYSTYEDYLAKAGLSEEEITEAAKRAIGGAEPGGAADGRLDAS